MLLVTIKNREATSSAIIYPSINRNAVRCHRATDCNQDLHQKQEIRGRFFKQMGSLDMLKLLLRWPLNNLQSSQTLNVDTRDISLKFPLSSDSYLKKPSNKYWCSFKCSVEWQIINFTWLINKICSFGTVV